MVLKWLTSTHCGVDFTLHDNLKDIAQLVTRIRPILELERDRGWTIDLTKCRFVGPYAATVLLALWMRAKEKRQTPKIIFPDKNAELNRFLEYSGMKLWMNGQAKPGAQTAIADKTIPLQIFRDAPYNSPMPIINLVKRHIEMDDEREEQLRTCVMEVIQNVEDHAQSPVGAVVCARFVECHSIVRVAIVDMGRGIRTTLAKAFPDTADVETAIRRVIKGNYSAKSRPNNMGQGMSTLWSLVSQQMGGSIFIVTEDGIAYNKRQWPKHQKLDFRFPGTGVFFQVPVADKQIAEAV